MTSDNNKDFTFDDEQDKGDEFLNREMRKGFLELEYRNKVFSRRRKPVEELTKSDLSFWKIVGPEATSFFLSAFGSIGFSGVRTAGFYFIVEKLLLEKYSIGDGLVISISVLAAAFALLAFEFFLIAYGFNKGKKKENLEANKAGLWSAIVTIGVIAIFSSLEIVDIDKLVGKDASIYIKLSAAIITAVSSVSVSFFSGENIGLIFLMHEKKKLELIAKNIKDISDYEESARASFRTTFANYLKKEARLEAKAVREDKSSEDKEIEPSILDESEKPDDFTLESGQNLNPDNKTKNEFSRWNKFKNSATKPAIRFILKNPASKIRDKFKLNSLQTASNWKRYANSEFYLNGNSVIKFTKQELNDFKVIKSLAEDICKIKLTTPQAREIITVITKIDGGQIADALAVKMGFDYWPNKDSTDDEFSEFWEKFEESAKDLGYTVLD